METLKCKWSALAGEVTPIFNKCQKALKDDPANLDLGQLEHQVKSIKSSDASYRKIDEEITDDFAEVIGPCGYKEQRPCGYKE